VYSAPQAHLAFACSRYSFEFLLTNFRGWLASDANGSSQPGAVRFDLLPLTGTPASVSKAPDYTKGQ